MKDKTKAMYKIVDNIKKETKKLNSICGEVPEGDATYCNGHVNPCPFRSPKNDCLLAMVFNDDVEML